MTRDEILSKIKKLQTLGLSENPNESANANMLADKLIAKYNVTPEELESIKDKKPLYGDNEKLFHTDVVVGWKNLVALATAKHFNCYVVQEQSFPTEGQSVYDYFVYGEEQDVEAVKIAFKALINKIDQMVLSNCLGRGPTYVHSYCEGLAQAIKDNLDYESIFIPKSQVVEQSSKITETPKKSIEVADKLPKEKPAQTTTNVANQSMIKDVMAYFKGCKDGAKLSLQEVVDYELNSGSINKGLI